MRISRDKLVERFEEIVKQEIINHNKQMEATNRALVQMQSSIDKLAQQAAYQTAINNKIFHNMKIRLQELKCDHQENYRHISDSIDNINEKNLFKHEELDRRIEYIEGNYSEEAAVDEKLTDLTQSMEMFSNQIDVLKFFLQTEIYTLHSTCENWIKEFKKEIENRPSETILLKKDLEKKIADAVVDAKGVLRELQVIKKENLIMLKKIENIYSLLGKTPDGGKL